jgi:DNA/RNA endonuclease G (NUC1)
MKRIHYWILFFVLIGVLLASIYLIAKYFEKKQQQSGQRATTESPVSESPVSESPVSERVIPERVISESHEQPSNTDTSNTVSLASIRYIYSHRSHEHAPQGYPYDGDTTDDYLIVRPQYVASYCAEKNSPNWVAWELNHTWVGSVDRYSGRFITDNSLPSHFTVIRHDHYTNSGYDRGHLLRSKERSATEDDNRSTFILSNIIPQTPDLNRGVWLRFEDYYLNRMMRGNYNIYVVSGGTYHSGMTLRSEGLVAVPDSCFKVVLFTPADKSPESWTTQDLEIVAVMMPNVQGIRRDDWQQYQTTLANIERQTGYRFMLRLPDSLQRHLSHSSTFSDH